MHHVMIRSSDQHLIRNTEGNQTMNKSEQREVNKLKQWHQAGLVDISTLARSMSALIRAAMSNRSKIELSRIAADMKCDKHYDFIV